MNDQITTLNPTAVEAIFKTETTQGGCLVALYKMVFPNWEEIAAVDGFPVCNKHTWTRICNCFQIFDRELNKTRPAYNELMLGGAWLNNGFSTLEAPADLKDWEVVRCAVKLQEPSPATLQAGTP